MNWTARRRALLGTVPDTQLAKRWGCSPYTVTDKRRRLGIPASWQPWTTTQKNFLRQHYATKGKEWCAQQLDKSPAAISAKAHLLGLTRRPRDSDGRRIPRTERVRAILEAGSIDPVLTASEVARRFGVSYQAVTDIWRRYDSEGRREAMGLTRRRLDSDGRPMPRTARTRAILEVGIQEPSLTASEVARRFGVSPTAVSAIWRRYDIAARREAAKQQ